MSCLKSNKIMENDNYHVILHLIFTTILTVLFFLLLHSSGKFRTEFDYLALFLASCWFWALSFCVLGPLFGAEW